MPNRFYYINLVLDSSLHVSDAFRALFLHPLLFPHPREPFLLPKHIFLALIEFVLFCDPLSLIRDIWVTRDTGTLPCGLMLTRTYTSEDNLSLDSPPPPVSDGLVIKARAPGAPLSNNWLLTVPVLCWARPEQATSAVSPPEDHVSQPIFLGPAS